jgi:hypothetical protein
VEQHTLIEFSEMLALEPPECDRFRFLEERVHAGRIQSVMSILTVVFSRFGSGKIETL